jgi:PAS domain S-box-containing protein
MKIMKTTTDQKKVQSKYFDLLKSNSVPLISWGFSASYQREIKNIRLDFKKIVDLSNSKKWKNADWNFKNILEEKVILITDANLNIVFASRNMHKMNGYREAEVLGKRPKMFQGTETVLQTSIEIREAIALQKPFVKQVVNYKKNGNLYYCDIEGYPVFNAKGELVNFIAFEQAA